MRFDLQTREGMWALLQAYLDVHPALRSEAIALDAIRAATGAYPKNNVLEPHNLFAAAFEYGLQQGWLSREEFHTMMAIQRRSKHENMNRY